MEPEVSSKKYANNLLLIGKIIVFLKPAAEVENFPAGC
jgi:hypothetical protein